MRKDRFNSLEEEKEYCISIANAYLNGESLRAISAKKGVSHVTIRTDLLMRLPSFDLNLFNEVHDALTNNKPLDINDIQVQKRVLSATLLLINYDYTIDAIASSLKVSVMIIYRDLTVRLRQYHQLNPVTITDEMLQLVEETLNRHSSNNLELGRGKSGPSQPRNENGNFTRRN